VAVIDYQLNVAGFLALIEMNAFVIYVWFRVFVIKSNVKFWKKKLRFARQKKIIFELLCCPKKKFWMKQITITLQVKWSFPYCFCG
jgi:hypothetical protein